MNLARALRIFLWSYVFLYAVFSSLSITQVDLWWQLAEGQHILHTGTLPTQPAAAFGLPATPYFDEYAGYEVVLVPIYHFAGFVGIWAAFSAIYLTILFLPAATTGRKYPAFDMASILALVAAILLIHPRLEQRPELVGVLFQVLLMVLLRASNLEKITARLVICLPLLFVAWSNTHSTFLFGLITLGLWIANEAWRLRSSVPMTLLARRGVMLALLAVAAAALTPYGPQRLLFPFLQASDPGSTALSPEMWPVSLSSPIMKGILLFALGLLAWGIVTTRRLPLWIIAFSIFTVVISFKSFRFIDFATVSILFVYAARNEQDNDRVRTFPLLISLARDLSLIMLCVFSLGMDVFGLLGIYSDLRGELRFPTHGLRYASDMAAYPVEAEDHRIPVLCGHGMGAYLSFGENGNFRPLLDSGLSHFSDDTKRYFFFLWNEPAALDVALTRLHVEYILLNSETTPWIPTIARSPNWQFVTCSVNGAIWKRSPGASHPLRESDRALISGTIEKQMQKDDPVGAFFLSTLVDPPATSIALIGHAKGMPWIDIFFNSFSDWAARLSPEEVEPLLTSDACTAHPLLGAILAARLGPQAYDRFVAAHPDKLGVWYAKALAAKMLVAEGKTEEARHVLESISPTPPASTFYYRVWHEVYAGNPKGVALGPYGQWQTWDASEVPFMEAMSERLNERLAKLAPLP